MSNNPSNERGGRRPAPSSSLSLGQVGRDEAPLLLPIPPHSSVEEISSLVAASGATRVELLVPDNTSALQSIAGNEALREAARAAGVRVTLFTADEKTTHAARFAKLDVVSVGGTVAAPGPGDAARRPTGARPAVRPPGATAPVPPSSGQQPPTQASARPAQRAAQGAAPSTPAGPPAQSRVSPTPAPQRPAGNPDDEFLSRLDAFDDVAAPEPPRARQSDQGALLFDVPGDMGVARPAQNDEEWQTFGQQRPVIDEAQLAPPPRPTKPPGRLQPIEERRTPRPSLLSALFGFLPQRRRPMAEADAELADDDGMRMARPDRSPEESAARQRQSRNLLLGPLLMIGVLLLGVVLIVYVVSGPNSGISRLFAGFLPGTAPALAVEPPRNTATEQQFSALSIPLVSQPVTNADSINVRGVLLTAPVQITLQGSASKTALSPIGFASGSILIRNRSSQPITIPAGTSVFGGGQEFVVGEDVTVPARVDTEAGSTFGSATAVLEASVPGGQGNIAAGTITEIPGYSGTLAVRQDEAFSGGSDQDVPIVSPDDVNVLLPQALSQLYGQGVASLQSQVTQTPGFSLIDSGDTAEISPTVELLRQIPLEELEVFPPIGQVIDPSLNGRFTLQISKQFEALASPNDQPIEQQIQRATANLLRRQGQTVTDDEVSITGWQRSSAGLLVDATVTPRGGYLPVTPAQQNEIVQAIRGKSRAEAEQYLADLRQRGAIGNFTLPDGLETVPENITLTVSAPEPQPSAP